MTHKKNLFLHILNLHPFKVIFLYSTLVLHTLPINEVQMVYIAALVGIERVDKRRESKKYLERRVK